MQYIDIHVLIVSDTSCGICFDNIRATVSNIIWLIMMVKYSVESCLSNVTQFKKSKLMVMDISFHFDGIKTTISFYTFSITIHDITSIVSFEFVLDVMYQCKDKLNGIIVLQRS